MSTYDAFFSSELSPVDLAPPQDGTQEVPRAMAEGSQPSEQNADLCDRQFRQQAAYSAMERALGLWMAYGDFCAAADYYAARRRWLRLKEHNE